MIARWNKEDSNACIGDDDDDGNDCDDDDDGVA